MSRPQYPDFYGPDRRLHGPLRWVVVVGGGMLLGGAAFLVYWMSTSGIDVDWGNALIVACAFPLLAWLSAGCWAWFLRDMVDQSARLLTVIVGNPGVYFPLPMVIWLARQGTSALETVAFTVAVLAPTALPSIIVMYLLFRRRYEVPKFSGKCHDCGYDLTGNVSGRCPECGSRILDLPLLKGGNRFADDRR